MKRVAYFWMVVLMLVACGAEAKFNLNRFFDGVVDAITDLAKGKIDFNSNPSNNAYNPAGINGDALSTTYPLGVPLPNLAIIESAVKRYQAEQQRQRQQQEQ